MFDQQNGMGGGDDFGTMPGEGRPQGTIGPQEKQFIAQQVLAPIDEVRDLLISRMDVLGDDKIAPLVQAIYDTQVANAFAALLPEIADLIQQVNRSASGGPQQPTSAPQSPMPGHGQMAQGGLAPAPGGDLYEQTSREMSAPSPMPQPGGAPMGRSSPMAPDEAARRAGPLGMIR